MHPKTPKNPRGAGRMPKYKTEEARLAARRAKNRRYALKVKRRRIIKVAIYLTIQEAELLDAILSRSKQPTRAAAVRWLIANN